MQQLTTLIPDVDVFLALKPEELASKLIFLLRQRKEHKFHPSNCNNEIYNFAKPAYPAQRRNDVLLAMSEAWG